MDIQGTVYVEVTCSLRIALSRATAGWNDDDKQALLDGEQEARDELRRSVAYEARMTPDDDAVEHIEINIAAPPSPRNQDTKEDR